MENKIKYQIKSKKEDEMDTKSLWKKAQLASVEVRSGAYLQPAHEIEAFADYDGIDYTAYPMWITTDDGVTPEGMRNIEDFEDFMKKLES